MTDKTLRAIDGLWWPPGYSTDPNGKVVGPQGCEPHFTFGYDLGYKEALGLRDRSTQGPAATEAPSDEQIGAATRIAGAKQTPFEAGCEVLAWLRENGAPYGMLARMSICIQQNNPDATPAPAVGASPGPSDEHFKALAEKDEFWEPMDGYPGRYEINAVKFARAAIALAAVGASVQPSDWLPIEWAPKDGRTLLLGYFNSAGKWRTLRGQWMSADYIAENWEEPDEGEPGWYETVVESDDMPNAWRTNPTHYQLLPKEPGASVQPVLASPRYAAPYIGPVHAPTGNVVLYPTQYKAKLLEWHRKGWDAALASSTPTKGGEAS